jgi:hypothetical protein
MAQRGSRARSDARDVDAELREPDGVAETLLSRPEMTGANSFG